METHTKKENKDKLHTEISQKGRVQIQDLFVELLSCSKKNKRIHQGDQIKKKNYSKKCI